jgi:CRISPR type III-A-associated protein Csm2
MRDWKSDLAKRHGDGKGGGVVKKCKCGKSISNPKFDLCYDCSQKARSSHQGTSFIGSAKLPEGYLQGGYFEEKNGKKYIREEVFVSWAQNVSEALKASGLAPTAIRKFFTKLRAIEHKYKVSRDFDLAVQDLHSFHRDVKYAENREVASPLFTSFIEINSTLAKNSPEHFKAFVEHFQSVIAYYKG